MTPSRWRPRVQNLDGAVFDSCRPNNADHRALGRALGRDARTFKGGSLVRSL